jgi:hypothetical protein
MNASQAVGLSILGFPDRQHCGQLPSYAIELRGVAPIPLLQPDNARSFFNRALSSIRARRERPCIFTARLPHLYIKEEQTWRSGNGRRREAINSWATFGRRSAQRHGQTLRR